MTAPKYDILLDPQRRGNPFRYSSALENSWVYTMFDGGILFTVRKRVPPSTVLDDTDADVVAQVSLAGGGIIFTSTTAFTVLIPGSVTKLWPAKVLHWDMQGIVLGTPDSPYDIAAGTVPVLGDVTRTQ